MRNITKIVVLMSLLVCVLLSVVSCNLPFIPMETTTNEEITGTTTPEENTPDDLYTLEMQTVFEMARNAGYTGTLEELIAMFRGEAGPAGKDGVTPHIGANGNWWVGDTDLGVAAQGAQGPQGEPGRGILKMEIVNGELIVYYTDGTSQNLGPIVNTNPDIGGTTPPEVTTPPEGDPDPDDEPLIDMEGYTYSAYVRSNAVTGNPVEDGNPSFYCEDFWVDPSYGEPEDAISYCVYLRNSTIEREYNVKIRQVEQTRNMAEELTDLFLDGECFDLTIILAKSGAQAATMGLLQDLNSLPALMLEQTAYDQNSIRELSIAGKLYYLSGDMNISTMDCLMPTVVNMERYEMFADAFVEYFENPLYSNVYNVVSLGEWTTSTLLAMAELASTDADTSDGPLGASRWDDVGYFQYAASTLYYFYGAGGRLTEINENGEPEFVIQEEQNQEFFEYLFYTMNKYNRDVPLPYGYSAARKTHFITNQSTLFTDMTLWDIRKDLYVNGEFAYGILPTPTYNEGDDYHSVVHFSNMAHLWAIPTLCGDMFNAQLMMATMAACSDITLTDSTMYAYYYRILYFATAPDPDARRTMDIIRNSTVYDIGLLYDWGGWVYELEKLGEMSSNNYGSLVSTMPFDAIPLLRKTVEQFKNPEFPY